MCNVCGRKGDMNCAHKAQQSTNNNDLQNHKL